MKPNDFKKQMLKSIKDNLQTEIKANLTTDLLADIDVKIDHDHKKNTVNVSISRNVQK